MYDDCYKTEDDYGNDKAEKSLKEVKTPSPVKPNHTISNQKDELGFFKKGFLDDPPITKVLNDDRIEKKEDSRTCVQNDGDVF